MKTAIISFFHTESSLCLAKYLAKQGIEVDYYTLVTFIHDRGARAGFEYKNVRKKIGCKYITREESPEIYQYTNGLSVNYYVIRIFWLSRLAYFFNKMIIKIAMQQVIRKKYDVINIVGQNDYLVNIHNELKKEKIIHTIHEVGSHYDGVSTSLLIDTLIKDATPIIFHSKSTANRFERIKNSGRCRTAVIPFGKFETCLLYVRDINLNIKLNNSNAPTFLFFGLIRAYKGLDILYDAVKRLYSYKEKFNLVIAGAGYDQTLDSFKLLPNCVVINKFLSNDEMMNLIKMCNVVILPYRTASQTGIIPTCFLYKKPVIATKVGAFLESVKDGYNGLLVEKEDSIALSEAIKRCIENNDFVKHLSAGASTYGRGDDYDWDIIAKKTLKIYQQL